MMKKSCGLTLVLLAILSLSFSALAQSGVNRRKGGAQKSESDSNINRSNDSKTVIKPKSAENQSPENEDRSNQTDVIVDDELLRVETDLVTIPVSVYDRDGRFVSNLQKEDFQVWENNAPQEVAYFAATETPYVVALVLDTSRSTRFKMDEIQTAAYQFVMGLRPNDQVVVVTFDEETRFLNEPTNDRETLRLAIKQARFGSGTSLYEAVGRTFERMKKIKGRKAIVLFTDGVDTTSRAANDSDNFYQARELDALVYPVYYNTYEDVQNQIANPPIGNPNPIPGSPVPLPQQTPTIPGTSIPFPQLPNRRRNPQPGTRPGNFPNDPRNDPQNDPTDPSVNRPRDDQNVIIGGGGTSQEYQRGKAYLEKLAVYTGGRFYSADSYLGLGKAFDQINEDLRRQYSLGYYPTTEGKFGDRRDIKVKVNRKKVSVRARDGYVVGKKESKRG